MEFSLHPNDQECSFKGDRGIIRQLLDNRVFFLCNFNFFKYIVSKQMTSLDQKIQNFGQMAF